MGGSEGLGADVRRAWAQLSQGAEAVDGAWLKRPLWRLRGSEAWRKGALPTQEALGEREAFRVFVLDAAGLPTPQTALSLEQELFLALLSGLWLRGKALQGEAEAVLWEAWVKLGQGKGVGPRLDPLAARLYQLLLDTFHAGLALGGAAGEEGERREERLLWLRVQLDQRLLLPLTRHMREAETVLVNGVLRVLSGLALFQEALGWLEARGERRQLDGREPHGRELHLQPHQQARQLYYVALLEAAEHNYGRASKSLKAALSLVQQGHGIGFRQHAQRLLILVELVGQGPEPERALFRQPIFRRCLGPLGELVQATKRASLPAFQRAAERLREAERGSKRPLLLLSTLLSKLKTNLTLHLLRDVGRAYERISLGELEGLLELGESSPEALEHLVGSAIRSGALKARLLRPDKHLVMELGGLGPSPPLHPTPLLRLHRSLLNAHHL